jgi:hypothetical protein
MVPVSIRTGEEAEPWTNRVFGFVVDVPTNLDDPLERVARCRGAMTSAKERFDLVPAHDLVDITQYSPPVVATSAIRLASRIRLPERLPPINVVISNVPGPREPLYLEGAQMDQYIPVSTIAQGMGLNITVHSYLDQLAFGLISCRELVPDLWDLVDLHIDEIDVLFKASGATRAEPERPAPPRRGGPGRAGAAPATTSPARRRPAKKAPSRQRPAKKTAARRTSPAKKQKATAASTRKRAAS